MNIHHLYGIALLGLAIPLMAAGATPDAPPPKPDTSLRSTGGYIQLRDGSADNAITCNLPVGGTGSGQTLVYSLYADSNPCRSLDDKADWIYFSELPSATRITLTDNDTCYTGTDSSKRGKFWVKLKTTLKMTSPENMSMQYFFSQNIGSLIKPGLLLEDRYLEGDAGNALDSLGCVKVITSRSTLPKPVGPISATPQEWYDVGHEQSHDFQCGNDRWALVGRKHYGDEYLQGRTWYKCASASQNSTPVVFKNHRRTESYMTGEHNNNDFVLRFTCPVNTVMTGREHYGDENGYDHYTCAEAWVGETRLEVVADDTWGPRQETENAEYVCPDSKFLIGYSQYGDENGHEFYRCGTIMPNAD